MEIRRFEPDRRLLVGAALVGLGGLGLTGIAIARTPRPALFSYLVAYTFWCGAALGALGWLLAFHAVRARWPVLVRRLLEVLAAAAPLYALAFLPIALGAQHLFAWLGAAPLSAEASALVAHQRPYLNWPFFVARAALYFALWLGTGGVLLRWSVQQDACGLPLYSHRARILASATLPVIGLLMLFASFDWLMSLQPDWGSTIFGFYFTAGSVMAAMALLILATVLVERMGYLRALIGPAHYHNLGKLLFAFVCFWAYIAFSQYMLIWITDLPHEITWYAVRTRGSWSVVAIFLVVGHFALPFFLMLSREVKQRPRTLAAFALWLLVAHWVDLYWVVMPALEPESASPRWSDVTAFVGIGGLAVAYFLWRLGGLYPVPIRDPYLEHSLVYGRR